MLISSILSEGSERIYRSSNRRKSLVTIPRRRRNFSQKKVPQMEEYCVRSDAKFGNHGRRVDPHKANTPSLAIRTSTIQLRTFHSRVPIFSRGRRDGRGVSAQSYLTMSSSPHVFEFNSPVNTLPLYFSPLTECTTSSQWLNKVYPFPRLNIAATM